MKGKNDLTILYITFVCLAMVLSFAGFMSFDYGQNLRWLEAEHGIRINDITLGGNVKTPVQLYRDGVLTSFAGFGLALGLSGLMFHLWHNKTFK